MFQATFLQKVVLSLVAGAVLGGLVEFYKTFIAGADEALNGNRPNKYSVQGKR